MVADKLERENRIHITIKSAISCFLFVCFRFYFVISWQLTQRQPKTWDSALNMNLKISERNDFLSKISVLVTFPSF
jgi:hypothetical protein